MNGTLPIPAHRKLNWQYFTVAGGPYRERPGDMFGVKMAIEISAPCEVNIPTRDFSTPTTFDVNNGLVKVIDAMKRGEMIYVGCMGGKGRTGLFLALLAKAFGEKQPVEYVRKLYYSHAVETTDQYAYVMNFEFSHDVRKAVRRARYAAWRRFWKMNLTERPCSLEQFEEAQVRFKGRQASYR